jgi:hypothetical protein
MAFPPPRLSELPLDHSSARSSNCSIFFHSASALPTAYPTGRLWDRSLDGSFLPVFNGFPENLHTGSLFWSLVAFHAGAGRHAKKDVDKRMWSIWSAIGLREAGKRTKGVMWRAAP